MIVNVFDWRANLKMASNKISSKVSAVCFAEDGSYFVTVGNRHVKYWYLEGGRKVSGGMWQAVSQTNLLILLSLSFSTVQRSHSSDGSQRHFG